MAAVAAAVVERRDEPRCAGGGPRWRHDAVLRPGQPITLVNICRRAALLESPARLRPGANTEMQLTAADARISIRGRLERCHVAALQPIRYRALLIFDQHLEIGVGHETGSE